MKKICKIILQTSSALIFVLAINSVQASECIQTPDCASLGYTQTESNCNGLDAIKCPFDTTKVLCLDVSDNQVVETGSILYGDGTISRSLIADKKPIGIVFDVLNRLALALTDVNKDGSAGSVMMPWSSSYCDTPNLENCEDQSTLFTTCGLDGRKNTDAILASTCNGTTYAADAVNAYQHANCSADFCQKGKWFLPSIRDLNTINHFKNVINTSLTSLGSFGANNLQELWYWSSTELSDKNAWSFLINDDEWLSGKTLGSGYYVRPVVKF